MGKQWGGGGFGGGCGWVGGGGGLVGCGGGGGGFLGGWVVGGGGGVVCWGTWQLHAEIAQDFARGGSLWSLLEDGKIVSRRNKGSLIPTPHLTAPSQGDRSPSNSRALSELTYPITRQIPALPKPARGGVYIRPLSDGSIVRDHISSTWDHSVG